VKPNQTTKEFAVTIGVRAVYTASETYLVEADSEEEAREAALQQARDADTDDVHATGGEWSFDVEDVTEEPTDEA
jgi:hypothetical protein